MGSLVTIDLPASVDQKFAEDPFQPFGCKSVAEMLQFKTIKLRSGRNRVEATGDKMAGALLALHSPSVPRTNVDLARNDPEGAPSVIGFVKQAVVPLIILLASIAAFAVIVAHMSGQPGYSARGTVSSPTSIE